MHIKKKKTVLVGNIKLGGNDSVVIQSMTNTKNCDVEATIAQIESLQKAGCQIVRLAFCNVDEIKALKTIIKNSKIPLVADIQFDYKLAVIAGDIGFSGIRFNPGNIGSERAVAEVVASAKANKIPIRVGVNLGSLEKDIEKQYGRTAEALATSCLNHASILERHSFYDIVLSVKASDAKTTIEANRILHNKSDYPLHIGITESGFGQYGAIKSAVGIGGLLADGIGDTIRVSLTGNPIDEIAVAKMILRASGRCKSGVEIVSCPTCARCNIDLSFLASEIAEFVGEIDTPLKIALMGCVVNGPGEAKDADIALCGGSDGRCVLYEKGIKIKTMLVEEALAELKKLIIKLSAGDRVSPLQF